MNFLPLSFIYLISKSKCIIQSTLNSVPTSKATSQKLSKTWPRDRGAVYDRRPFAVLFLPNPDNLKHPTWMHWSHKSIA